MITAGSGTTLWVGDFVSNAVCPYGSAGCNGSMTLTFGFDVNNVSFDYGFGNTGDSALVQAYDSFGTLLSTIILSLDSGVAFADLSSIGTLRSLVFDNTAATGAGYAYGNITYTAAVPLPASLPLLLAGLGGIAALRRKAKAA